MNSRRSFLIGLTGVAAGLFRERLFAAQDFWNRKKPGEWSSQEVRQLVTRSPWAKDVRVELKAATRGGYDGGAGTEEPSRRYEVVQPGGPIPMGPAGSGPMAGIAAPSDSELPGQIGDVRRGTGGNIPMEALGATVRWESAQPLVDALHTQFPADFAEHYVIGVSGLPVLEGRPFQVGDEGMMDRLKASATLQAKGKSPYQAGVVWRSRAGTWFGFAQESMPLTPSDRDVMFLFRANQLELRATFQPKEMLYLGKLAV
ncbi:MAG TPA: hypothetical protein VEF06_13765 [Bryobacteraceae bacterium]|nr:hypothetical protein [Bryobacteraceae bacterium]